MAKFFKSTANSTRYSFSLLTLFMLFLQFGRTADSTTFVVWASDQNTNPKNQYNCIDVMEFSSTAGSTYGYYRPKKDYYALECPEANLTSTPFITRSLSKYIESRIDLSKGLKFPDIIICEGRYKISFSGQCIDGVKISDRIKNQFLMVSNSAAEELEQDGCQLEYRPHELTGWEIFGIVAGSIAFCVIALICGCCVIPDAIEARRKRKEAALDQEQRKLISDVDDARALVSDKNFSFKYGAIS